AGHETTATALAWALYWLHHQPDVQTRLCQELSSLGIHPDPLELLHLPYLNAVCNETLRIHPVGMLSFPRQAQSDFTLMDYPIKAGTILIGCIYQTHQRPDLYPNPQAFNPDRFLNRQYTPYEFLPFGGGLRRCMGEALAQFELKIVLATVIQYYVLTLADSQPEKPKRR
ncbi:MAG: cytochrome P450, partial [Microcystaceae cyanobacterium]